MCVIQDLSWSELEGTEEKFLRKRVLSAVAPLRYVMDAASQLRLSHVCFEVSGCCSYFKQADALAFPETNVCFSGSA